jgi:hypothetical protein
VSIVSDAILSQETQRASLSVLAPNGSPIATHPPSADAQKDDRYITLVFASIREGKNTEFGREMYAKLTHLLEDGPGSIPAALERIVASKVSGVGLKVVSRAWEIRSLVKDTCLVNVVMNR